jgi:hypothetical protein
MTSTLTAMFLFLVAASVGAPGEELSFRGEIVEVDLEGSLLVVKARKAGDAVERLFEVDELSTKIRDGVPPELAPGRERDEPTPIVLADLKVGDYVEIHYETIKGRNIATLIERNRARHA